jgi:hypothetical protein
MRGVDDEAGDLDELVVVGGGICLELACGDCEGLFGECNCNCKENKKNAEEAYAPCV